MGWETGKVGLETVRMNQRLGLETVGWNGD